MDPLAQRDLTRAFSKAEAGDPAAAEELLPLLYEELRRLASARLSKLPPGQTLQTTALVHEAYLRVAGRRAGWEGKAHFFHAAARAMRDILVEDARSKAALKRGGDRHRVPLHDAGLVIEAPGEDVLAVDEALEVLERKDPEKAQIVLLRFFSGLSIEETAEVLDISTATLERRWRLVRAWLRRQLAANQEGEADE